MKIKIIITILIIIVLLTNLSGCSTKNENIQVENIQVDNILVKAGTYEFSYFEVINGKEITYTKEIEEASLTVVLNDWISDLNKKKVNYGNTPEGNSILEGLEVKAAYLKGNTVIIAMNEAFAYFDKGYSNPVDFINGLKYILEQVTEASDFSIEAEGYNSNIIHPDGVLIKNLQLKAIKNKTNQ